MTQINLNILFYDDQSIDFYIGLWHWYFSYSLEIREFHGALNNTCMHCPLTRACPRQIKKNFLTFHYVR